MWLSAISAIRQIGSLTTSLVCSSLFSSHTRAATSGSAAVLRGRDYSASFYRTYARRRTLSKQEPDRELRGRLAGLKGGLCSGLKAWQACRALSYRVRQQAKGATVNDARNSQLGALPPTWTSTGKTSPPRYFLDFLNREDFTPALFPELAQPGRPQPRAISSRTATLQQDRNAPAGPQHSSRTATL